MQMRGPVRNRSPGALAPWQLRRAIRLLLAATASGCSVASLARACGLSASHFAHGFKAATGVPPHRWLLLHRLACARDMMLAGTESLSSIAVSCGFSDQSHLTRVFRSEMGCSPAAWRRQQRAGVSARELADLSLE